MQQHLQKQKKTVGLLGYILLPLNMTPAWVTSTVLLGWKTVQRKDNELKLRLWFPRDAVYGDIGLSKNYLFLYLSPNPANDNSTFLEKNSLAPPSKAVDQRDADLIHF